MTKHSRSDSFSLPTGNKAPQDALLSTESIEVRPLVPKGILSVRQTGIGHSSFSSGVSSFGLELIFETIIPVQVTTTTQRYIPIPNAHVR